MLLRILNASVLLSFGLGFVACQPASQNKAEVASSKEVVRRPTKLVPNQQKQALEASITDEQDGKKIYEILNLKEKTATSYFAKEFKTSDGIVTLQCIRNKLPVGIAYSCDISLLLSDDPKLKTKIESVGTSFVATMSAEDSANLALGAESIEFVTHDEKLSLKCKGEKAAPQCKLQLRLK